MILRDAFEALLRPHPDEADRTVLPQEEARGERLTAVIRVLYMLVWLAATAASRGVHSRVANLVNLWGGALWFLWALAYQVYLLRRPYQPWHKYLSFTVDTLFSMGMLFLYQYDELGVTSTLKSPTFMNAFLILALTALRFDAALPLYGGILTAVLYGGILLYFSLSGGLPLGTRAEMYTTAKVNGTFLMFNLVYLATFTGAMTAVVRHARRLVRLRAQEAARAFTEQHERDRMRATLERYFTPQVAKHLLENPPALGGKLQTATVLFADLRNFTRLSERLGPVGSVTFLNALFAKLVEIVFKHGGTLDKFLGDGMLVAFGVPEPRPGDALRAVRAAEEMVRAAEVTEEWAGLEVGVAINTGEVIVGNIGAPTRMEFTVIGDTVNTASRLEHLNKTFRTTIILSHATYEAVREMVAVRELPPTSIVGKTGVVRIYEFTGWKEGPSEAMA